VSDETGLIQQPTRNALTDLRSQAMAAMSVEDIRAGLAEYQERRQAFRAWLLSQMVLGVHYGYPPGLAPKYDDKGNMIQSSWDKKNNQYKTTLVSPDSWTAKPSLYKAGADFICDLMGVIDVYEADMTAWQQLGSPQKTFVFACRLYPKGASHCPETLIGEGRGCRSVGQKGGDENNTIKMAKKCAKVDAVLNGYGLADLFTQDIEDLQPEPHQNPQPKADAPKVVPRSQRATPDEVMSAYKAFQDHRDALGRPNDKAAFEAWINVVAPNVLNRGLSNASTSWTQEDIGKVREALKKERGN